MRKAHPIAADTIQLVFCFAMSHWASDTFQADRSHAWTRYWWMLITILWLVWSFNAFHRLWKRFREGPAAS